MFSHNDGPFHRCAWLLAPFLILFLLLPMRAGAACPDFAPAVSYGVGFLPISVAAGDFNGDGRPDLVVANSFSSNVSVLLANGPGTFAAAVTYATGGGAYSVVTADFDRDGDLDLAVVIPSGNTISILEGNGDGTFAAATSVAVNAPTFLVAADVDRDGTVDLVVASGGVNTIAILEGDGGGGFAAPVYFPSGGSGPSSIAVDDFNRDGAPDLLVANQTGNNIALLLGDGLGSFGAAITFDVPGNSVSLLPRPVSLATGDFNGDGKRDVAVANSTSRNVAIFPGNGAGSFGTPSALDLSAEPRAIIMTDVNGDAKDDLAVAQYDNDPTFQAIVSTFTGDGDGNFVTSATIHFAAGSAPAALAAADFNRDGKLDLATANRGTHQASVLLNTGHCYVNCATFANAVDHPTTGSPDSIAFADFNRDGYLDFAITSPASDVVDVFLASAAGVFSTPTSYGAGDDPQFVVAGDFNGDGIADLAVANATPGLVSVLIGNGSGGFALPVSYPAGTKPVALAVGDFNRDGKLDLATADWAVAEVSILIGNGSGAFARTSWHTVGSYPQSVTVADFNRDGITDLAVAAEASGVVSLLTGAGDGSFLAGGHVDAGTAPRFVAAGDFNGDGLADLAVANAGSNNVSILIANGAGTFATAVHYGAGSAPSSLAVADFDRDGRLDVAVSNSDANGLAFLSGNEDGTFAAAVALSGGSASSSIAAADLDGDGAPELVIARTASSNAGILRNTCPAPDLSVVKSHNGILQPGQTVIYEIVVSNVAPTPTAGMVTLTDVIPPGLTATVIDGDGWTCTLATLTCTRTDTLAGNSSYPPITVAATVDSSPPAVVTNIATVSGGAQVNNANDVASDPAMVLIAPPNVTATAVSTSRVDIAWDAIPAAANYQVFRKSGGSGFVHIVTVEASSLSDLGRAAGTAYVYHVRSVSSTSIISAPSNADLATTIFFTDDPLFAGATVVQAAHLIELRSAVNAVRATAALSPVDFSDAAAAGLLIKAAQITELRSGLDAARSALLLPAVVHADPTLAPGILVKAAHMQAIRDGTK